MPNFSTHCKTGAIIGAGWGFVIAMHEQKTGQDFDWGKLLNYMAAGALGGLTGSIVPDFLEPANNPNHRSVAHSCTTGIFFTNEVLKTFAQNISPNKGSKWVFLTAMSIGYVSHLVLDSGTPKGLPFLV